MGRVIGLGQMLEIQPRIDLGGADMGVAEQLLDRAQVPAGGEPSNSVGFVARSNSRAVA